MSSLFSKIAHFIHTAKVKVSEVFVKLFGQDASEKFAQASLAMLKTAEGKIVLDAVEAVQSLATDGAGKRAAAFEKILAEFKTQGYEVGESVVNLLVEMAVQYLRGAIAAA